MHASGWIRFEVNLNYICDGVGGDRSHDLDYACRVLGMIQFDLNEVVWSNMWMLDSLGLLNTYVYWRYHPKTYEYLVCI